MSLEQWILLLNLASTGVMIGIIWFVQVVHYPLFARAGADGFGWYAAAHARWTTWVVGPPMLLEAGTGLLLVRWRPEAIPLTAALAGFLVIILLWASTTMVQVPLHNALSQGWNPAAHRRLVATNWIRTLLWTGRGVLVLWMLTLVM